MLVLYWFHQGEVYMKSSFNPSFCPARTDIKKPSVVSSPGEEPVFRMGELVMHPSEGICTVKDMKPMDFSNHVRTYYVLKPAAEKSSSIVYLPVFSIVTCSCTGC